MTDQYLKNKNYLYQLGDGRGDYFIFPKAELTVDTKLSLKSQYEDSNFIDGAIRTNLGARNNLSAAEFNLDFIVNGNEYFDIGYVKKILNKGVQKAYFYNLDANGFLTMFFNPVIDTVTPFNPNEKPVGDLGQTIERVSTTLKSPVPFLYECKSNIAYFDYDNYTISNFVYQLANPVTYNGTKFYGEGAILSTITLSSLTLDQKLEFFTSCNSTKALVYTDKFFDKSSFGITPGQEVINRTLTANTVADQATSTIYKNTTADNRIYLIEITGSLLTNEWLTVNNLDNNSGLKLTWTSNSPSPSVIYYNSAWERFYNAAGAEIDPLSYRLEQPQPNFLYFSPLASQNKTLIKQTETIRLQKNAANNLTIKIENLNTYQI